MSEVWTGSKCAVLTAAREPKSLDHLAEYVTLGQFAAGEAGQVVVLIQQARHGVALAVAGRQGVGEGDRD